MTNFSDREELIKSLWPKQDSNELAVFRRIKREEAEQYHREFFRRKYLNSRSGRAFCNNYKESDECESVSYSLHSDSETKSKSKIIADKDKDDFRLVAVVCILLLISFLLLNYFK